jgi:hypothetical protein
MLRPSQRLTSGRSGLVRQFHASEKASILKQKQPPIVVVPSKPRFTTDDQKESLSKRQEGKQVQHGELLKDSGGRCFMHHIAPMA